MAEPDNSSVEVGGVFGEWLIEDRLTSYSHVLFINSSANSTTGVSFVLFRILSNGLNKERINVEYFVVMKSSICKETIMAYKLLCMKRQNSVRQKL